MSAATRARRVRAPPFLEPPGYARHRPEATLLYQLVERHYPAFREMRAEAGRSLPDYIEQEFDAYLKCGRLEEGFLRVRCETCHAEKLVAFSCKKREFCPSCAARRMAETAELLVDQVLPERPLRQWVLSLPNALRFLLARNPAALTQVPGVVYRVISGDLLKPAGLTRTTGHTGAMTLIQRFGSALNLNLHFHTLFLDGVYRVDGKGAPVFRQSAAPSAPDLQVLLERIALRIGPTLEKRGLIERDIENAWLAGDGEVGALDDLLGHSNTYRIAVGPRAGQKLFTLQTVPTRSPQWLDDPGGAVRAGGLSLHAGIDIAPGQRATLERLCRYVSRPPVATERMTLTSSGQVRYQLKTPYRDGTTRLVIEPLDLMARLAGLVPPPRMHLTRYHGVFDPHSKLRAAVTPAHRGIGAPQRTGPVTDSVQPPTPRHAAMSWARRLKRVFGIEIEDCARCGGKPRVVATSERPANRACG